MAKRIPYFQQLEVSDCGAACLAMNLAFHGKNVTPEEVRRATKTSRGGVNAASIVQAARSFGMEARGLKVEPETLDYLNRGAILHWEFNHFVVFDRVRRGGVEILDPAVGRITVPMERFSQAFTGVAIDLRPSETFEPSTGGRRGAWRYVRPLLKQSNILWKVLVTSGLIQAFALATPILMGVVVDRVVPLGDRDLLLVVALGLMTMVLFHMFSTYVRGHLLLSVRAHLDRILSASFIDHLVRLPYRFFLQRSTGDLMARLNSNVTVREILTGGTISTILDGILVAGYLVLIFALSVTMGAVVLLLGALQIAIPITTRRSIQRLMAENLQAQARSQGYLAQMVGGIETLKAVGAEGRAVSQWLNLFVDEINASIQRGRMNVVIETLTGALRVVSPVAVLVVGTLGVLNGDLTLGSMLAVTALATGFLTPLSNLVITGLQIQVLGSYMERINDVLDASPEQDPEGVTPAGELAGRIDLESVSFRYADNDPEVVRSVSLSIEPGQTVGIVGRSGSGKSTLAHLILGLYPPSSGRVLYDGVDLVGLEAGSVRGQLGIVPQHSFLFGTSIRANITLTDPDASMEKIEAAARLAAIHDDIIAMPLGYDTVLADGGASLSGGQRQRIALARAVIHRPSILLLDEATSSLDSVTEKVIHQNLDALACTRIVIAHRISTIARSDLIVVMEDGAFVEQGTHDELMALRGRYFDLATSQGTMEMDSH